MLGMYDLPPLHAANDRFWQAIRARLEYGPATLTRADDPWPLWRDPGLVLAQTCGMPYRVHLHGHVDLVGTPDYGLPGCPPGFYNSVMVVRRDDPAQELADMAGQRFAYNEGISQSGWAAPMTHLGEQGIVMGELVQTGAHVASARAVAEGRADLAGLDALTWALLQTHDTVAHNLRVLDVTTPTPGLPYITGRGGDVGGLAEAVRGAIEDLAPEDRAALHLHGLQTIPAARYLAVPTPPGP